MKRNIFKSQESKFQIQIKPPTVSQQIQTDSEQDDSKSNSLFISGSYIHTPDNQAKKVKKKVKDEKLGRQHLEKYEDFHQSIIFEEQ